MSTLPADDFRTPTANGSSLIRQVEETDLPELVRLDEEAFPEGPYPFFTLRQLFDLYPDHMLVLDGGENGLHGYVLVGMPRDAHRCWILSLGVTRDRRGRGYGRQLMAAVLRQLRDDAVREVLLTVEPSNITAIELYKSLGFAAESAPRKDYFGPNADRLVMTLHL